jgi:circadian clock protein KaiB
MKADRPRTAAPKKVPTGAARAAFKFQLYVAADSQNSTEATANLRSLCLQYLPGRHEIEIVDVFREPQRALAEDIRMTPTLLKVSPRPARRIIGTLSQTQRVLDTLGLTAGPA